MTEPPRPHRSRHADGNRSHLGAEPLRDPPPELPLAPLIGTAAACTAAGRARATHYRRHCTSPAPQRPVRVLHVDRAQPAALSAQERAEVLEVLHSQRFCDAAPAQVWATLLDENRYLASEMSGRCLPPGGCDHLPSDHEEQHLATPQMGSSDSAQRRPR